MKILQVTATMDPRAGGVAEAVRQIGAALVRAGHETEVVTTDAPGAEWLGRLPFPAHGSGPGKGRSLPVCAGIVGVSAGRRDEFDCVLSHGLWQYHGFATWRAWRGARGPRFVFAHGMLDPWFKRTYPKKHLKKWLYWPWAEYRVLRSARAVFFTCEEERRLARASFWLYRVNGGGERAGNRGTAGGKGRREDKDEGRWMRDTKTDAGCGMRDAESRGLKVRRLSRRQSLRLTPGQRSGRRRRFLYAFPELHGEADRIVPGELGREEGGRRIARGHLRRWRINRKMPPCW